MTNDATQSDPESARLASSNVWFEDASAWIVRGGVLLGALRAVQALALSLGIGRTEAAAVAEAVAAAAYLGVAHALAGFLLAAPVRALGVWLDGRGREGSLRGPAVASFAPPPAQPDAPSAAPVAVAPGRDAAGQAAEVRGLIREGAWESAEERARAFVAEHEGDPRGPALIEELERARRDAADRWREQLQAAREVNDPARVLELYEGVPPVLDDPARRDLDSELAGWFLAVVHRRLRSGLLQIEVVTLVERVSATFGHTKEGASLRAALPTLRRGAGLCARCGKPYTGLADACPECLGGAAPPPPVIPELDPVDDLEPISVEDEEPSWFLDDDEEQNDGNPDGEANGRLRP